jgi:hypothetical protein
LRLKEMYFAQAKCQHLIYWDNSRFLKSCDFCKN